MTGWLDITAGNAPLIISIPHAGTEIPADITGLRSIPHAIYDADYHTDALYAFAADMDATIIRTKISRSAIDVNRDPSGVSLYPGQTTTGLCPETLFDGRPLYSDGKIPDAEEVARRRHSYFAPYHDAIANQISRLREKFPAIVLYDAHSIFSNVSRLFEGELPLFNIGSFDGKSCAPALMNSIVSCVSDQSHVVNGRFKGGWITRHYGRPEAGVHAVQMELAMRGYLNESGPWPPVWDASSAAPMQKTLRHILINCINFAKDIS